MNSPIFSDVDFFHRKTFFICGEKLGKVSFFRSESSHNCGKKIIKPKIKSSRNALVVKVELKIDQVWVFKFKKFIKSARFSFILQ